MVAAGVGVFDNDLAMEYTGQLLERLLADIDESLERGNDSTALAAMQLLSAIWEVSPFCPPDRAIAVAWRTKLRVAIAQGNWVDPGERMAEVDAVLARLAEQAAWLPLAHECKAPQKDLPELFVGINGLRGLGNRKVHLTTATLQQGGITSHCQRYKADAALAQPLPIGTRLIRKQTCGWCWGLSHQWGHLVAQLPQQSGENA